jgi:hypothetical protein
LTARKNGFSAARDDAFRWLRKAYEERVLLIVFINVAA